MTDPDPAGPGKPRPPRTMTVEPAGPGRTAATDLRAPTPDRRPDWVPGTVVRGIYEVRGLLGAGGMGSVHRVHHREWDREFAVKSPFARWRGNRVFAERFIREALAWIELGAHPNIVQCHYVEVLDGLPRIFVDLATGGSLDQWIRDGRVAPAHLGRILDLMIQTCDGLGTAHALGMVHRDVKPANLLLTSGGSLSVTDFGLVKVETGVEEDGDPFDLDGAAGIDPAGRNLTRAGAVMGTLEYASPEQLTSAAHVDPRADVYSVGITLFELCTGSRPYDAPDETLTVETLIARHKSAPIPDPRDRGGHIPASLALLIRTCMAKDPEDRPSDMATLRARLAEIRVWLDGTSSPRPLPAAADLRAAGLNNKAVSLWNLDRREEAAACWDEALLVDGLHPETLYNGLMRDWLAARLTDEVVADRLAAIGDHQPRGLHYRGLAELERFAPDRAIAFLEQARADPELAADGGLIRALGDAYLGTGRFDEAGACYQTALDRLSGDRELAARRALVRAFTRMSGRQPVVPWVRALSPIPAGMEAVDRIHRTASGALLAASAAGGLVRLDPGGSAPARLPDPGGGGEGVTGVASTRDRLFVADGKGRLHVLDATSGRLLGTGAPAGIPTGGLSIDGPAELAVVGTGGGQLVLWDLRTGRCRGSLAAHRGPVRAVLLGATADLVLSAGDDATLAVWEVRTGQLLRRVGLEAPILALVADRDRYHVIAGDNRGWIQMWETRGASCIREYRGHTGAVRALAPIGDGRHLVSVGDDRTLRIWSLATGRCLRTLELDLAPRGLAIDPEASLAFVGGARDHVVAVRIELPAVPPPFTPRVSRLMSHAESRRVALAFDEKIAAAVNALQFENLAQAWTSVVEARRVNGYERDPRALELVARLAGRLERRGIVGAWFSRSLGRSRTTRAIRVVPATGAILVLGGTGPLTGDDPEGGTRVEEGPLDSGWPLRGGTIPGDVRCVEVDRTGETLHAGRADGALLRSGLDGGGEELDGRHSGAVTALASLASRPWLVSAGEDGWLRVRVRATGELRATIPAHDRAILALAGSPREACVLTASSDRTLGLFDLAQGSRRRVLAGHDDVVTSVLFLGDGTRAISGSEDQTLALWNLRTGELERRFTGHTGGVTQVAATGDGEFVLSGSRDGVLRAWRVADGACTLELDLHGPPVHALVLTVDARRAVVAAGEDLRVLELDWELDPGSNEKPRSAMLGLLARVSGRS